MDSLPSGEAQFDQAIMKMDMKGLIETVSQLQKMMAVEQEQFNQLTVQLRPLQSGTDEHNAVSEGLVASQNRLTLLMGRNMKCFNQQAVNQQKSLLLLNNNNLTAPDATMSTVSKKPITVKEVTEVTVKQSPIKPDLSSISIETKARSNGIRRSSSSSSERSTGSFSGKNMVIIENTSPQGNKINVQTSNQHHNSLGNSSCGNEQEMKIPRQTSRTGVLLNYNEDKQGDINKAATNDSQASIASLIPGLDAGKQHKQRGETNKNTENGKSGLAEKPVEKTAIQTRIRTDPLNSKPKEQPTNDDRFMIIIDADYRVDKEHLNTPEEDAKFVIYEGQSDDLTDDTDDDDSDEFPPPPPPLILEDEKNIHGKLAPVVEAKVSVLSVVESVAQPIEKVAHEKRDAPLPPPNKRLSVSEEVVVKVDSRHLRNESPAKLQTFKPQTTSPRSKEDKEIVPQSDSHKIIVTAKEHITTLHKTTPGKRDSSESSAERRVIRGKSPGKSKPKSPEKSKPKSPVVCLPNTNMGNKFGVTIHTEEKVEDEDSEIEVEYGHDGSETVKPRATMKNWDPTKLLKDLYEVRYAEEIKTEELVPQYINMEGYLEKLPINKKKATLLKAWKRRYFKAIRGSLYYYDNNHTDKASGMFRLMGGEVVDLGMRTLGIDDGRGHYLMVRSPSDDDYFKWRGSLESQVIDNCTDTYVKPSLTSLPHPDKKIVVIDLGSCSIRAGILCEKPTLPQIFFPTIAAVDNETAEVQYGFNAFKPEVRRDSELVHPIKSSCQAEKSTSCLRPFSIDMSLMPGLFKKIFTDLAIDPAQFWIMFSTPQIFADKMKEEFLDLLIKEFNVLGVHMMNQSVLSLYSYNMSSGIVVDIGDRLDIVPITEGYKVGGGEARQAYGGGSVTEGLNSVLTECKYRFFTDIEKFIVRHVMEQSSYVAKDFQRELAQYNADPKSCQTTIDLTEYDMPKGTYKNVKVDLGRFKSPQGLFNTAVWGLDSPSLVTLVKNAIQACPMDMRREMCRSVCLAGGTTLIPGFAEKLQSEISKIVASSITVQVHASPQRYHAAYIGACVLALMPNVFESSAISSQQWKDSVSKILRKWQGM